MEMTFFLKSNVLRKAFEKNFLHKAVSKNIRMYTETQTASTRPYVALCVLLPEGGRRKRPGEKKKKVYLLNILFPQEAFGDVTERRRLREQLGCKSFKWFLDNIFPELPVPEDRPGRFGMVRSQSEPSGFEWTLELAP